MINVLIDDSPWTLSVVKFCFSARNLIFVHTLLQLLQMPVHMLQHASNHRWLVNYVPASNCLQYGSTARAMSTQGAPVHPNNP